MMGLRSAASRIAFALARGQVAAVVVRWGFTHMAGWLPVSKLYETGSVVLFYHPKPAYPVHILIVPKRGIAGIRRVGPGDGPLLGDIVVVAQEVVRALGLERHGYRLVVNGGAYQDVGQLHFHLISDGGAEGRCPG